MTQLDCQNLERSLSECGEAALRRRTFAEGPQSKVGELSVGKERVPRLAISRNFELLKEMGQTQLLLGSDTGPVTDPAPEVTPEVFFPVPLQIDGMAREEITRVVHRLFVLGSTEGPRRVAFACTEIGSWKHIHVCACWRDSGFAGRPFGLSGGLQFPIASWVG